MEYLFGHSRVTAKAAHNPWAKISMADLDKFLTKQNKRGCKRVAECLAVMAPLLEEAANKIIIEEWWKTVWLQTRIVIFVLFLLLLFGGMSLVTEVVYSGSYIKAIKTIWNRLKENALFKRFT